jgi:hypothetical protein
MKLASAERETDERRFHGGGLLINQLQELGARRGPVRNKRRKLPGTFSARFRLGCIPSSRSRQHRCLDGPILLPALPGILDFRDKKSTAMLIIRLIKNECRDRQHESAGASALSHDD